jgi:hypothetical protein
MKLFFLLSSLLLIISPSVAQKSPIKFGDIPIEDLKMTSYQKDSSASALILADYGKAYVSSTSVGAVLYFERHMRIKILKNQGLGWADASIPLYHSGTAEEKVTRFNATTYNLEGEKIVESKVSKDGIFKEKFNKRINLQKFTFPNVKEGSVIEYSYTIMSDFLTNFPNWQFQYTIPSRLSEYYAIIPEFFVMERYMQGYLAPTTYEVKDKTQDGYFEKAHHWVLKDVPAFKEEPFITTVDDYQSKINFALAYLNFPRQPSQEIMGTWDKLTKELLESEAFGKAVNGSSFLKKKVEELVAHSTDSLEKITLIKNYVATTLEWDGTNDYLADNLKDVFEKKKGTVGDINLALASMLTKAGFEVDLVLLSTRDHGFIRKQYPMSKQLNYVVCRVLLKDKFIFIDATNKYLPIDVLPENCLNGEGLLVSKRNTGWVGLNTKAKSKSIVATDLVLDSQGIITGTISIQNSGYKAIRFRRQYQSKGEETYVKDFIKDKNWEVEKSSFHQVDDLTKDPKENYNITLSDYVTTVGNMMYINPFITSRLEENPFKADKREYPVDFGSNQESNYMGKFTLPNDYQVEELPKSKVIMMPGGLAKFTYSVTQIGNTLNIIGNLQINRGLFGQEDYANLREFYNQLVSKQAEQIVLKKK